VPINVPFRQFRVVGGDQNACGGHRPGGREATPERTMAARWPPRRQGPLRHGGWARNGEPLEHTPCPACLGLVFSTRL